MKISGRALLIALPIEREEFLAAARGKHFCHYVREVLRDRDSEEAWKSDYESVCMALKQLVEIAHSLNIQVYERADIHALARSSACEEIILFAHWKGEFFSRDDFLDGPRRLLELAEETASPAATAIKLSLLTLDRSDTEDEQDERHSLAEAFNRLINTNCLLPFMPEIIQRIKAAPSFLRALSRDLIDEVLAGGIVPGNRLELSDGLHLPKSVSGAFPSDFHGTVELALCQSEILGAYLDHQHGQRIRLIQGSALVDPIPRCHIVAHALSIAVRNELSYVEARKQTETGLLDQFRGHLPSDTASPSVI